MCTGYSFLYQPPGSNQLLMGEQMTKEELEKEAEEIYQKTDKDFMDCQDEGEIFNLGYLAGAEPREKRITELEAQIEEMKCCENCRWEQPCSFCDDCKRNRGPIFPETSDNWSLRRNLNE